MKDQHQDGTERPLQRLIAPMTEERFFADHWEKSHFLCAASASGAQEGIGDLLTLGDLEDALMEFALAGPQLRIVRGGDILPRSAYTRDLGTSNARLRERVIPGEALALMQTGATLVFQGLQVWHPGVRRFCAELSRQLGGGVAANAYLTPPSARGLALHCDPADVFVCQIFGRKTWRIAAPQIDCPLEKQFAQVDPDREPDVLDNLILAPGDRLFVPRGFLHDAKATADSASLHLTISLRLPNWIDVLRATVDDTAEDVAFRRSVRIAPRTETEIGQLGPVGLSQRIWALMVRANPSAAARLADTGGINPPDERAPDLSVIALGTLPGADARLVIRSGQRGKACDEVKHLRRRKSFAVKDLKSETEEGKQRLAARLIARGILDLA